ncbi:MAG: dihydropteroate synthase [Desulfovibrionaceae bacterium]
MNTTQQTWFLKGGKAFEPAPFGIMGIVNVTPDSFFDGGTHADTESAVQHATRLVQEGAHILDLGAESSRPHAKPVSPQEEQARLLPVLESVRARHPEVLLSVDTFHADTAARALDAGADIINDISACMVEPALREVLAHYKPGYVLMHSQGKPETMQQSPQYTDVVDEVLRFFEHHLHVLTQAGLPADRIVLDPGIGFGKYVQHNVELLKNIDRFMVLGRPVLVGISMKSFLGDVLNLPVQERADATQVMTALLAEKGVAYHRVHHVSATRHSLALVQAMCGA